MLSNKKDTNFSNNSDLFIFLSQKSIFGTVRELVHHKIWYPARPPWTQYVVYFLIAGVFDWLYFNLHFFPVSPTLTRKRTIPLTVDTDHIVCKPALIQKAKFWILCLFIHRLLALFTFFPDVRAKFIFSNNTTRI